VTVATEPQILVFAHRNAPAWTRHGVRCTASLSVVHHWVAEHTAHGVLIVCDGAGLAERAWEPHHARVRVRTLLWNDVDLRLRALYDAVFERAQARPRAILPTEDIIAVFRAPNRRDLCIGGTVVPESGTLILVRGDLDTLLVPLSAFQPSATAVRPDFADFEVIDSGQSLRFGQYEASVDAVLYEHDSDYRRRLKAQRRSEDGGLAASIRRLRLQKGLRQEDFGEVTAKTVARIENGEVKRPQRATLAVIATRLGVEVGKLGEW